VVVIASVVGIRRVSAESGVVRIGGGANSSVTGSIETRVPRGIITIGAVVLLSSLFILSLGENAGEKLTPPLPLLRFPLLPEKTWTWKGKIVVKSGSGDAEATMSVSGPEEVEVSAGKFTALQVHCEQILYGRLNGKPTRAPLPVDYWFAPGVGLVQRKVRLPYTTVDIRLKSFKIEP